MFVKSISKPKGIHPFSVAKFHSHWLQLLSGYRGLTHLVFFTVWQDRLQNHTFLFSCSSIDCLTTWFSDLCPTHGSSIRWEATAEFPAAVGSSASDSAVGVVAVFGCRFLVCLGRAVWYAWCWSVRYFVQERPKALVQNPCLPKHPTTPSPKPFWVKTRSVCRGHVLGFFVSVRTLEALESQMFVPFLCDRVFVQTVHSTHAYVARPRTILSRVTQDLSHRVMFHVCLTKRVIHFIQHSMSHALSLLFPSQLSTSSHSTLSTCTHIRPSTRPSTRPLLMSSSHGDYPCADPSNVSFGPMAETT